MIGVRLGDETTTYTLNADKTLTTDQQLYWTSAAPATVTAWYPTDESVDLSDQSEGLAYMLKAEVPGATYDNKITLSFKHQLAKVRVVLNGTQASLAQSVEVYGYTTCTNNEGAPIAGDTQGWLKMKHTTYTDGTECWEANVVPATITLDNFVRINGQTATVNDGFPTTLDASTMYTIDLTVGPKQIFGGETISDDGHYRISGTLGEAVTITGGKPTIYLEDAQISVASGNAIDIQGGNPTIHVKGNDNEVSSNNGAGIYVAEGYSVTITSDDKTANSITLTGKGGAGIGGHLASGQHSACGNIIIQNVTVIASSSYSLGMQGYNPGIGGSGNAACGKISITNAIVYAYGSNGPNQGSPAIGAGLDDSMNPGSVPTIQIETSDIYAHRGNYADYIGQSGDRNNSRGDFQFGQEGYCRSSNVYCYTGSSDTLDKTVTYDASGNGTEQSQ